MSIAVRGLRRRFGSVVALDDVTLEVETGQLVALLGPSGCGKTTLLRTIAGLEAPDAGSVWLHQREATFLPVQRRRVGFVFQHYALFRHMTVFDNVAFGLTVRPRRERPGRAEIRRRVEELLDLVQLSSAASRYPAQLSGGQRQRIALARALAIEPEVLLLDEPFGALDTQVRHELRRWLRRLHDALHFTSLFVTHDQQEALEVADEVVVMNRGRIEQRGAPELVYDVPQSEFVHRFVGTVNELPEDRCAGRVSWSEPAGAAGRVGNGLGRVLIRPHDVDVHRDGRGWSGTVRTVRPLGPIVRLEIDLADAGTAEPVIVEIGRERQDREQFRSGETVRATFRRWHVYPGPAAPSEAVA